MYASHVILRTNIRKRLAELGVTANRAGKASRHGDNWLGMKLTPGQKKSPVITTVLDEIAELLNVPPWALIDPSGLDRGWPWPAWAFASREEGDDDAKSKNM